MSKYNWRRPLRWARNILLGAIGVLAVLVVAAYAFFETTYGKGVLRSQIESRMANMFVGGATVGGVEGNPLREIVLKDVVINDPTKQAAITVKRLTIKLPLLPLISHQLRVDKIIADDLDVRIAKLADGSLNVAKLMKPSEPSTWSVKLPNVEVHRGHVRVDATAEPVDIDAIELRVNAALPFAGPIDAWLAMSASWRQKQAPIDVTGAIHINDRETRVTSAIVHVDEIDMLVQQLALAKGAFGTPASGAVAIYAPARTVRRLAAIDLPGDVSVFVSARPDADNRWTHVVSNAFVGQSQMQLRAKADIQAKLVDGVLTAPRLDLPALTRGRLAGDGGGVVTFQLDGNDPATELPTVNAMISAWGHVGNGPPTKLRMAVKSEGERLVTFATASSDTGLRAMVEAVVRKHGDRITLESSTLVASTADARRASQGVVPLRGSLSANLRASGALAPRLDLAVAGQAAGRHIRFNDIAADSFALRIGAQHLPANPIGSARLEVADLRRGTLELGKLTLAAGNRPDGKLQVSVRSQPKQAPWLVDLDALVTTGQTITVDLQRHLVRAGGGSVWRGTTGTLTVSPREIRLQNFTSHSTGGSIAADATFVRAGRRTGDLTAKLDANVDLAKLHAAYRGSVDAHVDVTRIGGSLAGIVDAKASGVALGPRMQGVIDGTVKVDARGGKVVAAVDVGATKAGRARVALDIDAPADLADARAWRKLGRGAIRDARLTLDDIDLAKLAKLVGVEAIAGHVDGEIKLTPTDAGGLIRVRGVQTQQTKDLGAIEADVKVSESGPRELRTTITARLLPTQSAVAATDLTQDGAARFLADVRVAAPDQLFDPDAWRRLGARAFKGGSLRAERLAFQPGTLERLGIISDMRGELAIGAELDEGLRAARLAVNVHQLRGGLFAQPIAATVAAVLDEKSSRISASVVGRNVTLVRITGSIPLTLDQLRANPQAVKTSPLSLTATIPQIPAKALLETIGTSQISGGTLDGKIEVAGTVDRPTVDAKLVARNVTVPRESTRPTQAIEQLTIAATWDGAAAKVAIDGTENAGGKLRIRVAGSPTDLDHLTASLDATHLDIAPLVAFMPGPAGALGGQLDANFKLVGANPRTADIAGELHITNGRIPIAPAVGTLFHGDLRLGVKNRNVELKLNGKLGRGDVQLTASAPLDGATPKSGKLALTLRKVQLIGTTEPVLTGSVTADIARVDDVWRANMVVSRMTVKVPAAKGAKLSPVGAPTDLVYGGEKIHHGKHKGQDVPQGIIRASAGPTELKPPSQVEGPLAKRKQPDVPVFDVKIKIADVFVESEEARGLVGGNLKVTVAQNKEVGIIGRLALTRGVLDLFSRRYEVDKAMLMFDGSPDPMLDVRITHDFPDVTTITEVRGRMSKPELLLSANPNRYTQAELLGFLLGGEPGGDPDDAPSASTRVAGVGASYLANKIASPIKSALPVDIDVLRYETASSANSAAVTVGTWITDSLFLAYRRHLSARPDENTGEGQLEYWIRRRLMLEAVAGDRGVNGLDLLWRRRW